MSASKPTRSRAYGLHIVSPAGEAWYYFENRTSLARDLALRLYKATQRIDHHIKSGPRAPHTLVDERGVSIQWIRETPYQAEHTRFGATWRTRVEWKTFEPYGENGQPLPVRQLLREFDLLAYLQGTGSGRLRRGERGHGPVRGIRKRRGGFRWFRTIHTSQEKRIHALVLNDEGEVPARAARSAKNLPTAWDDFLRVPQRSWKKQSKARKQWA
jgi:hypothetical protein